MPGSTERDELSTPLPSASEAELEAAAPRRASRREVWVGIFAILGVLATLVTLFTLTDASMFRGRYLVTTTVQDAGGLRNGDPVQMRGVNIGRVRRFRMVPGGVQITLELDGQYKVPADSRVDLKSAGLLGGRVADIVPGQSSELLHAGMRLPGESAQGLTEATDALSQSAEQALNQVNALLSQPTVNAVGQSAQHLQATLADLAALVKAQRQQLTALTGSLRRSAAAVEDATSKGQLSAMTSHLDSAIARMDVTAASLGRASASLETVMGRMARGEGTLGRLSKDDSLYTNLNDAAVSLKALLADIKAHPGRYLTVKVF